LDEGNTVPARRICFWVRVNTGTRGKESCSGAVGARTLIVAKTSAFPDLVAILEIVLVPS